MKSVDIVNTGKKVRQFMTLPNLLTLLRIVLIPFIVACFYVSNFTARCVATALFTIACITDFFDGYLARQWKQISAFGRFLDPIADKLLVSTILLMLSGTGSITGTHLIAACIILAREIIVSGLREFLSEMRLRIPVTRYAKWKTATQMFSITCILAAAMFPKIEAIKSVGIIFLWIAVIMTLITGARYLKFGMIRIASESFSKKEKEL